MLTKEQYDAMLIERHGQKVFEILSKACVGIAGLGGLGSNIAMMLARSGIGRLLLIDFDVVEPSNLNRQHYMVSHLGMPKAENCPGLPIISGSGMAGYGSSNTIQTKKVMKNLYLCGDQVSGIESVGSLMAPRVQICAAHEANMALRLLLGIKDV